ncbi:NACHT domain-containing protein [Embleya scabrispora]|nr:NACHT domain-containing protein [Embleya scabrispora]
MGRARTGRAALIYLVLQVVAVALALWMSKQFQVARLSATAVTLTPTLPGAYLAWLAYRDDRREGADPNAKAEVLAAAVRAEETRQRAQLTGDGAHRIDLAFRYHREPANNATGAAAGGRLSTVTDYYRGVRPARLVVTGAPGAGKTVLALDLVLGLLTDPARTDADPVPVRISLADWNTELPLATWLTDQVHRRFRDRGISAADAATLVERHRILPVLDGLDEMDADTTAVPRRRAVAALRHLNAYQDAGGSAPVVLTCRTAQYRQLAALDVRMREAARIEIDPITPAQADAYLTSRSTDPTRWQPVVAALYAAPTGTLARSLDTPWRLNLATTVHEERDPDTLLPVHDPADLCALASPGVVRDHLLGHYLPAAVRRHPTRPGRHSPEQTHRRLAELAGHLARTTPTPGTDLVLHELWPMAGRLRVRVADALAALLTIAILGTLALALVGFSASEPSDAAIPALGALAAVVLAARATIPEPKIMRLHRLYVSGSYRVRVIAGVLTGVFVIVLAVAVAIRFAGGFVGTIAEGVVIALGVGGTAGLVVAFAGPLTDAPPNDPRRPVRDDLVVGLAFGVGVGFTYGLVFGITAGFVGGLTTGLAIGLPVGPYLFAGAGRRYLVFLCCARRRLPWRLGAFLHWSYDAGLLRISGTAYQFRHRELQEWLATHPDP